MLLSLPRTGAALVSTAIAALLTWLLLAALVPLLRRQLLDQPNARSSHQRPTPRGGGVAFVVVGSVLSAVFGEGRAAVLPLVCCPLALVGLLDDRLDLSAGLRYGAQLLTAAALLALATTPLPLWSWPLVVIAITAVINFFNFMDGLDGLVAGCAAVLFGLVATLPGGAGLEVLAGSLLGFLAWNWSPARVFMGDVGSTWLGAVFAGLVLQQRQPTQAAELLLVGLPLLADPLVCVLRRLADGQPVFQAHRLHLFQRLQQAGWGHRQVAVLYGGGTAALALALRLGGGGALAILAAGELALGAGLDRWRALSFRDCSTAQRRQT